MAGNRNRRRLALAVASAAACLALAGPTAAKVIKFPPPRGPFLFAASSEAIGTPGREPQPVKLNLGVGFLSPEAEAQRADRLVFGLDRSISLSLDGLSSCDPKIQIQAGPGDDLAHRCNPARLGGGHGRVSFRQEDGSVIVEPVQVLLVNGGTKGGITRIWLFIHYEWPFPSMSFVPIDLRPSERGSYGEEMVMKMPRIASGSGFITWLELHISRSYKAGGERRSVLSLSCPHSQTIRFSAELQRPDGSAARVPPVTQSCGQRRLASTDPVRGMTLRKTRDPAGYWIRLCERCSRLPGQFQRCPRLDSNQRPSD